MATAGLLFLLPLTAGPAAAASADLAGNTLLCTGAPQAACRAHFRFDPESHRVTVTLPDRDPSGSFIAGLRPESFAVYEDGIRQQDVSVEVQRAPLSIVILVEHGGRYHTLSEAVADEASQVAKALTEQILPADQTAVWIYADRAEQVSQLATGQAALRQALDKVGSSLFPSESNLYDALGGVLSQMQQVSGRKALLVISTGLDTFSRTGYQDILRSARECGTPIYAISLGSLLKEDPSLSLDTAPYALLGWKQADSALAQLTRVSGGRLYTPDSLIGIRGIYDDMLERLRARYVVSYRSASALPADSPRHVRVELSAPGTRSAMTAGGGRRSHPTLSLEDSYVPRDVRATG